jgi:membrane protein YdbS with pleckstrin-like domain
LFQLELTFFGHKQRKSFHVLDEGDLFLVVVIVQVVEALLIAACLLRRQFLLAHLHMLNELIELNFFLLQDVNEVPYIRVPFIDATRKPVMPAYRRNN